MEIAHRTLISLALGVLALLALLSVLGRLGTTVTAVVVGSLIAVGLQPLVRRAQRHVRSRSLALAFVLTLVGAIVTVILAFLVPAAIDQGRNLRDDVPEVVADLTKLPVIGPPLRDANAERQATKFLENAPSRLIGDGTPLLRIGTSVASGFVLAITILLVAVALVLDAGRVNGTLLRLSPTQYRLKAGRALDIAHDVLSRYVAGSMTVAGIAGLMVMTIGLVAGVPLAPLAGMWVMCTNLIPQIGGALGGVPFVALAFTQGGVTGLICLGLYLGYLQIENNVIAPLIVGKAVKLSPLITMVAALIGVSAGGVLGALVAVPIVGAIKAVMMSGKDDR